MQQSSRTQESERASPSGYLWVAIGLAMVDSSKPPKPGPSLGSESAIAK